MHKYPSHVSTRATSQRERTPGRTDEVKNSEGGYVHRVDDWQRLDRFLILGSEGGTFYVSEKKLTQDNATTIIELIARDGVRVVNRVVEISQEGRAHKNDAALFVLAMCAKLGSLQTKTLAYKSLPLVARIGTHLFMFAEFMEAFGGWGAGARRAVSRWYNDKKPDNLAYQLL
jgi:60 kDa SS-A/Ro ribonucleoprotein